MKDMYKELVCGMIEILSSNLVSIILYGSVARGTATEESDIDVAIIVNGKMSKVEQDRLSDFIVDLNLKYDKVFSVIDIENDQFNQWKDTLLFYKNIQNEGEVLWRAA